MPLDNETKEKLIDVFRDLSSLQELDPALDDALSFLRRDPDRFAAALRKVTDEENSPTNDTEASMTILAHMFEGVHEVQSTLRKEPGMFDSNSLLINSCDSFLQYSREFCGEVESTLTNVASFLFASREEDRKEISEIEPMKGQLRRRGGADAAGPAIPTTSLLRDFTALRKRFSNMACRIIKLCSYVTRLENQSHARLELDRKVPLLCRHFDALKESERSAVVQLVLQELEVRMEHRVFKSFCAFAAQAMGSDCEQMLATYHDVWRRQWEERKEDAASRALRATDKAIAGINEALVNFRNSASWNPMGNQPSEAQIDREARRSVKFGAALRTKWGEGHRTKSPPMKSPRAKSPVRHDEAAQQQQQPSEEERWRTAFTKRRPVSQPLPMAGTYLLRRQRPRSVLQRALNESRLREMEMLHFPPPDTSTRRSRSPPLSPWHQ